MNKKAQSKSPQSRFRIRFKSPRHKRAHVRLMTGTNNVGPSKTLIGGRQLVDPTSN